MGFTLFGWAYLATSLAPPVEARLLTTKGLAYMDSKLSDRVIAVTWGVATPGGSTATGKIEGLGEVTLKYELPK